jgi:hypothetical protein
MEDIDLDKCDLSIFGVPFLIGWMILGTLLVGLKFSDIIMTNIVIQAAIGSAIVTIIITPYILKRVGI